MKFWENTSVKKKFTIGIVVIFFLSVFSALTAVYSVAVLEREAGVLNEGARLNRSLLEREVQHLQWVNTLSNYIIAPQDTMLTVAKDPAKCGFGQWYYSDAKNDAVDLFPGLESHLAAIEAPHKALHATAQKIEDLKKSGDVDKARALFQQETLPALAGVQKELTGIRTEIQAGMVERNEEAARQTTIAKTMAIAAGTVICLAVLALAWILVVSVLRPLERITNFSRECLIDGDCTIKMNRKDEMGTLAANLNALMSHLNRELAYSRGVLQGITVPCSVFSPEDVTLFTNRHMMDLLERTGEPADMNGLTSGEYIWREKNRETLSTKALREDKALVAEMDFPAHRGTMKHVIVSSAPFHDKSGTTLGTLSIWIDLTDITEKQRLIEENSRRIAEIAAQAQDVSDNVSSATAEISVQVEQSSQGAVRQRDQVTETATAMTEMNQTVMDVARSATQASTIAAEARSRAQEGSAVVEKVVRGIGTVEKYAVDMKEGMGVLGQQAEGIGQIIDMINDIADQTNLLALNAAIEAARAGDAGRGFAVVADEVRKLAEKTMQATQQVSQVISGIQKSASENINNVELSAKAVSDAINLAQQAGETLGAIVSLVDDTAGQVQAIAAASEEQSATSNEINHSIEEVNRIAAETSTAMSEAASAVELVAGQASALQELIRRLQG